MDRETPSDRQFPFRTATFESYYQTIASEQTTEKIGLREGLKILSQPRNWRMKAVCTGDEVEPRSGAVEIATERRGSKDHEQG